MRHYFTIFLLWATLMNLFLEIEPMVELTEKELKELKGKFCGSNLSDMLSLVCKGIYNTKQKRNMYRDDYEYEEPILPFPFRSKEIANSMIQFQKRSITPGVATECCHKSCSLWEMASYCGSQ